MALSSGSDLDRDAAIPLAMRFSIKCSIDLEIGCTLNSGTATRNWTSNRKVSAGQWTRFNIPIAGDPLAPWEAGPGGFGLYFQIGLSCGATRLSTLDSVWNDGHYLMLESPTSATFLSTEGATAWLTACALTTARADDPSQGEPPALARLRTQRYDEKSYPVGVRPGTPNVQEGAFQIKANDGSAEDRVISKCRKASPPTGSFSKIFSPVSGAEGYAHDMSEGRDVPAQIGELACTHMFVIIPNSVPGHVYRIIGWPQSSADLEQAIMLFATGRSPTSLRPAAVCLSSASDPVWSTRLRCTNRRWVTHASPLGYCLL